MTGIYEIVNIVTNKRYIGSAKNIKKRFTQHKSLLRRGKHNYKFQNAWDKYGEESFTFDIIHECPEDMLIICEQWMIDQYDLRNDLYNSVPTAGNQLGMKHSEETKKKMSIAHKGRKLTDETKERMSKNHYQRYTPLTERQKNNLKTWKPGDKKGEKNNKAKLTEQDVINIHIEYNKGNINQTELGKRYNVGQDSISKILLGINWPHIKKKFINGL